MPVIDFALAHDFIDTADPTVPYRLGFHHAYLPDEDPDPHHANPAGQLYAVVKGRHPRRGSRITLSSSGIRYNDIEALMHPWPWREPDHTTINLTVIRQRLTSAGLTA